jgi:ubiquitin related modifier 1
VIAINTTLACARDHQNRAQLPSCSSSSSSSLLLSSSRAPSARAPANAHRHHEQRIMTRITIELGGGLDHLFGGVKVHEVDVPASASSESGDGGDANAEPLTVARLLPWARDHLLKERPELFMKGESV